MKVHEAGRNLIQTIIWLRKECLYFGPLMQVKIDAWTISRLSSSSYNNYLVMKNDEWFVVT